MESHVLSLQIQSKHFSRRYRLVSKSAWAQTIRHMYVQIKQQIVLATYLQLSIDKNSNSKYSCHEV